MARNLQIPGRNDQFPGNDPETIIAATAPRRAASQTVMTTAAIRRHLYLIVAVKLALLVAIWWGFFRDARVPVDPDGAATHLLSKPQEPSK